MWKALTLVATVAISWRVKAKSPPKPKRITFGIAMTAELNEATKALCQKLDMTRSQLVRFLIRRELEDRKP